MLEKTNNEKANELIKAKNEIVELTNDVNRFKKEKEQMEIDYQKKIDVFML